MHACSLISVADVHVFDSMLTIYCGICSHSLALGLGLPFLPIRDLQASASDRSGQQMTSLMQGELLQAQLMTSFGICVVVRMR